MTVKHAEDANLVGRRGEKGIAGGEEWEEMVGKGSELVGTGVSFYICNWKGSRKQELGWQPPALSC